jgi:hypothetical protein
MSRAQPQKKNLSLSYFSDSWPSIQVNNNTSQSSNYSLLKDSAAIMMASRPSLNNSL